MFAVSANKHELVVTVTTVSTFLVVTANLPIPSPLYLILFHLTASCSVFTPRNLQFLVPAATKIIFYYKCIILRHKQLKLTDKKSFF